MKPHCDRCDVLCDEQFPVWIEDKYSPRAGLNPTWHINIDNMDVPRIFCRKCRIEILTEHIKELKSVKGTGGHLADCRWDPSRRRYDCVEGCEIKRINEVTMRADEKL